MSKVPLMKKGLGVRYPMAMMILQLRVKPLAKRQGIRCEHHLVGSLSKSKIQAQALSQKTRLQVLM